MKVLRALVLGLGILICGCGRKTNTYYMNNKTHPTAYKNVPGASYGMDRYGSNRAFGNHGW